MTEDNFTQDTTNDEVQNLQDETVTDPKLPGWTAEECEVNFGNENDEGSGENFGDGDNEESALDFEKASEPQVEETE